MTVHNVLVVLPMEGPVPAAVGALETDPRWTLAVSRGLTATRAALAATPPDVVIGSEAGGAGLLDVVRAAAPKAHRIALVNPGAPGNADVMRRAHQVISTPWDDLHLEMAVDRGLGGMGRCRAERLRRVASDRVLLPARPRSAMALLQVLDDPESSPRDVVRVMEQDASLVAATLRAANSPMFRQPRRIASMQHAVMMLGLTMIRTLALTSLVTRAIPGAPASAVARLGDRSAFTAQLVRHVAGTRADEAIAAAVLQDVGQLVLLSQVTDYARWLQDAQEQRVPMVDIERERIGVTHAQVGAALLEAWELPERLITAVAMSHTPYPLPARGLDDLAVTWLTAALLTEVETGAPNTALADAAWVEAMGLGDKLEQCRAHAHDLAMHGPLA